MASQAEPEVKTEEPKSTESEPLPDPPSSDADGGDAGGGGESADTSPFARVEPPPPVVVIPSNPPPPVVDGAPSTDEPPKRGRGRPRKNATPPTTGGPTLALGTPSGDVKTTQAAALKSLFVDSKRAASVITAAIDGGLMALARARYGDAVDAHAITDAERAELIAVWEAFLKATGTQLSPGAALVVGLGGVYVTRGIGLEVAHRQARAAA
jgi:hypothetical protein